MTATFWTGSSLSFTNGSKTVTVNTGPSLDSVKANSSLTAGNYNEPVEVKSVSGNTIILYNNWPGSTGTTSATIKPSAAAAASAGVAAQQLITEIQSLVGSASATATANSFVKRDSNGRIKAASPSANDDVVTKGYFQSAAGLNAAGVFHSGNSVNPLSYGLSLVTNNGMRDSSGSIVNDLNLPAQPNQFFVFDSATTNRPITHQGLTIPNGVGITMSRDANIWGQLTISRAGASLGETVIRAKDGTNIKERTVFDSGNTNFNEFGGFGASDFVAIGHGFSSDTIMFYLPSFAVNLRATSISVTSNFEILSKSFGSFATSVVPALNTAQSGNKLTAISVNGLSSVIQGDVYYLRQSTNDSKIIVNF